MKHYLTISTAARIAAAVLLFYALQRHPYSYYTILRWVTCGTAAYTAYLAFQRQSVGWCWLLGIVAVFFNPFVPVALDRKTWATIDVATGVLLLISIAFVQESSKPKANNAGV
jgi:hypothetical protein